jgi:hypothetical protein
MGPWFTFEGGETIAHVNDPKCQGLRDRCLGKFAFDDSLKKLLACHGRDAIAGSEAIGKIGAG